MISRGGGRVWRALLFLALGGAAVGAVFLAASLRLPYDSPRACMYRTEADIASLAGAVESYQKARGAYPGPGQEGLGAATERASRVKDFFPSGPPPDAWGRPYYYVPHMDYDNPDWHAQRRGEGWCAPGRFQLFSAGADGVAGTGDDITSWDEGRGWRAAYGR